MSKFQLLKELECLIAFQKDCLDSGDWESFDKSVDKVRSLEEKILNWKS